MFRLNSSILRRSFNTQIYQNNSEWNKIFEPCSKSKQSASDLGIAALQKIQDNTITPIDYHNFAMKVSQMDSGSVDFVKNIIYKYGSTNLAQTPFDPTNHALIRGLMNIDADQDVIKLLEDRINSQVFLDFASANLMMENFAVKRDYSSMIIVFYEMCLQNYISADVNALLLAYGYHAISKYLEMGHFEEEEQEILSSEPVEKKEEEEPEYRRVPFVRNASNDNFFDVTSTRVKSAIVLDVLSKMVSSPTYQNSMKLFSHALRQTLAQVTELVSLVSPPVVLTKASHELLLRILKSTKTVEKPVGRGQEFLPTQAELDEAIKACEEKITISDQAENSVDLMKTLEALHQKIVTAPEFSQEQVQLANQLFENYAQMEKTLTQRIVKLNERKHALREAKKEIRNLLDREEFLTYFEKVPEIKLKAWLAPRTRAERTFSKMKKWRSDLVRYNEQKALATER